ncbi:hypothetical protein EV401DRAFT_620769 [Pisolithus croceorrhizus]|nr:hypothetical protein EV401DRAFT_620769 [Pisolithus croceorrhizus]
MVQKSSHTRRCYLNWTFHEPSTSPNSCERRCTFQVPISLILSGARHNQPLRLGFRKQGIRWNHEEWEYVNLPDGSKTSELQWATFTEESSLSTPGVNREGRRKSHWAGQPRRGGRLFGRCNRWLASTAKYQRHLACVSRSCSFSRVPCGSVGLPSIFPKRTTLLTSRSHMSLSLNWGSLEFASVGVIESEDVQLVKRNEQETQRIFIFVVRTPLSRLLITATVVAHVADIRARRMHGKLTTHTKHPPCLAKHADPAVEQVGRKGAADASNDELA